MAFVLAPKTTSFSFPVTIPAVNERGTTVRHQIELIFKKVSQTQWEAIAKRHEWPKDADGNNLPLQTEESLDLAAAQLKEVITDWKGVNDENADPVPCNTENLKVLLDNYPNAFSLIIDAFIRASFNGGEAARKN